MNTTCTLKPSTINRIRYIHESVYEGHWFSSDNKRFFKSRWNEPAYEIEAMAVGLFVSSEQHDDNPRFATIRMVCLNTGQFIPLDIPELEFQKYNTTTQARRVIESTDWMQYNDMINEWRDAQ